MVVGDAWPSMWHFVTVATECLHLAWEGVLGLALVLAFVHVITHRIGEKRVEAFNKQVIEALTGFPIYKAAETKFIKEHADWEAGKHGRLRAWRVAQIGEQKICEYEKLSAKASKARDEAWKWERAEAAVWEGNGIDSSNSNSWYAEAERCEREMDQILQPIQGEFDDEPEPVPPPRPALGRLESRIYQAWFWTCLSSIVLGYFWWNPWHWPYGRHAGGTTGGLDIVVGLGIPIVALPVSFAIGRVPSKLTMWVVVRLLTFIGWFMRKKNLQTASYIGALIELTRAVIEHF